MVAGQCVFDPLFPRDPKKNMKDEVNVCEMWVLWNTWRYIYFLALFVMAARQNEKTNIKISPKNGNSVQCIKRKTIQKTSHTML